MDDYARAGFRLLPIVDRDGHSTERQIVINCMALVGGRTRADAARPDRRLYFVVALLLGLGFLAAGIASALRPSRPRCGALVLASLIYLPVLLACMALGQGGADDATPTWSNRRSPLLLVGCVAALSTRSRSIIILVRN